MKIKKQFFHIIVGQTVLLLFLLFLIVSIAITRQNLVDVYKAASSLGHTVADQVNADDLVRYATTLGKDASYEETKTKLQRIKSNFPDCKFMYIFVPNDNGTATYVYDIYTEAEYKSGKVDEGALGFEEEFIKEVVGNAVGMYESGGEIKKLDLDIFNKYGSLASYYVPVYDSLGAIRAIIGIDYSIISIVTFIGMILVVMLIFFVLLGVLHGIYELNEIEKKIIKPIEIIKEKVDEYVRSEHNGNSMQYRIEVKEDSENEMDILGSDMNKMMQDMDDFIIEMERSTRDKQRIESELGLANRIQASYLPNIFPAFPDRKEFDLYATMDPAKEVGGDFYDFFMVDDSHLALVIADVSGKGVGAALFMMISKTMINNQAAFIKSPAEVLKSVNNRLCDNNDAEMFVTVWLGILDIDTGELTASNAGHEYPTIMRAGGNFELLKDKHGMIVGGFPGVSYPEYTIKLEPGDKLYLYTDGVAEATNAENELYGTDRLITALNKCKNGNQEEILKSIRKDIDDFVLDAPQFDDITMLGIEYCGKQN